jgi:hypothetical protein
MPVLTFPGQKGNISHILRLTITEIDPMKLQTQVDFMEAHPDVSMCFAASKRIFSDNREPQIHRYRKHDAVANMKDVIAMGGRMVDMGSAVVQRSIYQNTPDWYHYSQIWDLTVPLLAIIHGKIQYLDRVTSVYRYNVPGSWTNRNVKSYERRVNNLKRSIRVTDGFDQETNYQYHKLIQKKHNPILVEILLLINEQDPDFKELYDRLPLLPRLEYHFFKRLGIFKLWEIHRHKQKGGNRFLNLRLKSKFDFKPVHKPQKTRTGFSVQISGLQVSFNPESPGSLSFLID